MSVRLNNSGSREKYSYRFMFQGKDYSGQCYGCNTQKQAEKYESTIYASVARLGQAETISDLFENCRDMLIAENPVPLSDAWELSMKKPRKRGAGGQRTAFKKNYWQRFLSYMEENFPQIINMQEVTLSMAESFISYIRDMDYANATKNDIHMAVGQVFELLKSDTGVENPFRKIEKLSTETEGHEAYELDEIKVILQKCDSFLRPLFLVGFFTGLRLGDICTLRKDEIDFESRFIRRIQGKTGVLVSIPMSQPLYQYLSHSVTLSDGEYLFPELCRQVKENSKGMICNRVKKFLNEEIGIVTQKTVEGRARKINLKGIHSLRHTFCSIAGMAGIPLPVVQSIVGHMTEKMTEYYSRHIDDETKARYMTFFGNHISMITSGNGDSASLPDMRHGLFILPDHNMKKEKSLDSLLMEKISLLNESQKKDLLEKLEDPSFLEDEKFPVSVISEPPQKAENKLNPLMVYGGRLASVLGMLFKKNPA